MTQFGGVYKAVVVDIDDAQRRHRVAVLVHGVHAPNRPAATCPWAESCAPGGKGAGTFFGQRVGDLVWVMFEGGNPDYPVIVGAQNTSSMGVSDEPVGNQSDYKEGMRRWSHTDRKGNLLEMSENADESWVRMKSGGAEVRVTRMGDEVVISAPSGKIVVNGRQVEVNAGVVHAKTAQLDLEAEDFNALGIDDGTAVMRSNGRVEINAQDLRTGLLGEVAIGGAAARFKGIPLPPAPLPGLNTIPKQTPKLNLRGRNINLGGGLAGTLPTPLPSGDFTDALADFDFLTPLLPTLTINIRSTLGININTGGVLNIKADGNVNLMAGGAVTLTSALVMEIKALAALTISANGAVNLSATGAVNVAATGAMRVASTGPLVIEGSTISLTAGA